MQISTFRLPQDVPVHSCTNRTAVVIDVLRATTTIVTALYHGCISVIPVTEVEEAIGISRNFDPGERVLAGERECIRIDGFDLSNSPVEFTAEKVRDKVVFMTTTNGTKAIQGANAAQVWIAGFVNAGVTGASIAAQGRDVTIVCAGTLGRFSLEDTLAAGAVIHAVKEAGAAVELCDLSLASLCLYEKYNTGKKLHDILKQTQHYQRLKGLGFTEDLNLCLETDSMPILAEYRDGAVSWVK